MQGFLSIAITAVLSIDALMILALMVAAKKPEPAFVFVPELRR